ncbi:hypothetical protein CORC01_12833 [Colletotrichum orchidophilum]|uniref:Uncharacterized protein n=1 Tax=Colletotrichum orchidophilum TaxID=1209926 RepID=A0A1G4ARU4_9PEZI|nr:uncharacterized protein CORC01_12833 [Colletotrichum orchidophilum]OHE91880.1 hypothetical protein CORC01_12833 [Colletotrichum orchidophilum]
MQHTYIHFHATSFRMLPCHLSGANMSCATLRGGGQDKKHASSLVCAGRLRYRVAGLGPRLFTKVDHPAPSDAICPRGSGLCQVIVRSRSAGQVGPGGRVCLPT